MAADRVWPDAAVLPGEILADTLEATGMSQAELARRADRPLQAINQIVKGSKEITPETALQLERVLGVPTHVWTRLVADYRATKARLEDQKTLKAESRRAPDFPYGEMAKLGWVPSTRKPLERARHLLEFFGVVSLKMVPDPIAAYRRSTKVKLSPWALAAWLREGERQAVRLAVGPFDKPGLRQALSELRLMTRQPASELPRLGALLAECGVALVLVPHLKNTGVHGATRWVGGRATLQLSIRSRWHDVFWFTVFHECAHLLIHSQRRVFIEWDDRADEEAEKEADTFASRALIDEGAYERFVKTRDFSRARVRAFAKRHGIAPSLVVGRLHHDRQLPHSHLNDLRPRFTWAMSEDA